MPVRVVESKQNAKLKELRKALADPPRGPGAPAGIEGPHLVEEALRAGLRVKTIFVAQGAEGLVEGLGAAPDVEVLRLPKKLLDQALATETPQSIAALIEPPDWRWANLAGGAREPALILVLAGIQDPGNLGTMVRSAEAFGATGMVSLPGTVSAWNGKAVRASAGSVFRVPVIAASEGVCFKRLREAGVKILATSARDAEPAELADLSGPVAVLVGNEGKGISGDLMAKADAKVTVPCAGPVESLNAAVAASVILYEASRQRAIGASKSPGEAQQFSKGLLHAMGARR